MKIGIFECNNFSSGKENIIDKRLDTVKQMANSAKKTYIEVEIITDRQRLRECDGIITLKEKRIDLILTDMEFIEKRLTNVQEDDERSLLKKLKEQLEKEGFIFELQLSEEENRIASGYSLLTFRPVFLAEPADLEDRHKILHPAYTLFGYISFFTANEKDARAWPIKQGMSCWQASGLVHSDIQKGFIRAEVISFNDLTNDGGINQARANNHQRIEGKDYIVQDGDLIKFRFNK